MSSKEEVVAPPKATKFEKLSEHKKNSFQGPAFAFRRRPRQVFLEGYLESRRRRYSAQVIFIIELWQLSRRQRERRKKGAGHQDCNRPVNLNLTSSTQQKTEKTAHL